MSLINTQAFRSEIIKSGCSGADNEGVRHTFHFLKVALWTREAVCPVFALFSADL